MRGCRIFVWEDRDTLAGGWRRGRGNQAARDAPALCGRFWQYLSSRRVDRASGVGGWTAKCLRIVTIATPGSTSFWWRWNGLMLLIHVHEEPPEKQKRPLRSTVTDLTDSAVALTRTVENFTKQISFTKNWPNIVLSKRRFSFQFFENNFSVFF